MNYTLTAKSPAVTLRTGRNGFSSEADYINKEKNTLIQRFLGTVSLGEREREIISLMNSAARMYSNKDWDGYGALAVSLTTFIKTLEFLASLSVHVKLPDISAEPDGSMVLEWYRSPEWIFSVSINSDGKIDYAAIFGDAKHHGSMYFSGDVDRDILNMIGRV